MKIIYCLLLRITHATLAQAQAPKASKEIMAMANMIDHAAEPELQSRVKSRGS
jgi:hypothetical protein